MEVLTPAWRLGARTAFAQLVASGGYSAGESHLYELVAPISQVRAAYALPSQLLLKIDREFDVIGGGVDDDFKIAIGAALVTRRDKALARRAIRRGRYFPTGNKHSVSPRVQSVARFVRLSAVLTVGSELRLGGTRGKSSGDLDRHERQVAGSWHLLTLQGDLSSHWDEASVFRAPAGKQQADRHTNSKLARRAAH